MSSDGMSEDRLETDVSALAPTARVLLLVVSAPSGAGKTTLCDMLRREFPTIAYSVSCTTRAPRPGEADGEHYHFLTDEEFLRRVRAGEFLEHAVVHGYNYGTLRRHVADGLSAGRDVLMDIDVQGAAQIRGRVRRADADPALRRAFVDVFVAPPSLAELERRLVARGSDRREGIDTRLRNARREMAGMGDYRYLVINDRLEDAYDRLRAVFQAEHCRIVE